MTTRTHINMKGVVCTYSYLASEMNHKPRCEMCRKRMNLVSCWDDSKRYKTIGYICEKCKIVVISDSYVVLKGEIIKLEKKLKKVKEH